MKKKILCLVMTLVMTAGAATTAFARDYQGADGWQVTFDGSKMSSNFQDNDVTDEMANIQPGDSIELKVNVMNSDSGSTDWYMTNEVIQTLEDAQQSAAGGGYSYRLTYVGSDKKETVLYDSTTVGGEGSSKAGEGLKQVDNSTQEYFYLGRLASQESGTVHLTVGVEGETQGNGYQLTLAKLRMNFATEKVAQDTVTTIEKTEKTEVRGEDKVITTTKRVKSGDTNLMLRYSVIALASGVVCLILAVVTMNRRKKEAETAQRKGEKYYVEMEKIIRISSECIHNRRAWSCTSKGSTDCDTLHIQSDVISRK